METHDTHETQETQEAAPDPREGWAMDFTGSEGASLVEAAKQMEDEPPDRRGQQGEASTQAGPQRMALPEDLLSTTVMNGHDLIFEGTGHLLGQDMALTEQENATLTRYGKPVVKQMIPEGQKYLPGTIYACYMVNLMYKKFDIRKV